MTKSEYSLLKDEIILRASGTPRHGEILRSVKEIYKQSINSKRRYEQIETIAQLLKVLEIRDVLSENSIEPLKEVARRLQDNNELLRKITDYELISVSKKDLNNTVSSFTATHDKKIESVIKLNPFGGNLSPRKKERLFETIIEETGTNWRALARKLKIRECVIIKIDAEETTLADKVKKILEIYEQRADPQRWFFVLCDALEESYRRDIADSLRNIIVMNI